MTMPAFAEASLASQAAFSAVMRAFARPGEICRVEGAVAPAALSPATAVVIETLADYETPVWLDPALEKEPAVREWIRFHGGAPLTAKPGEAAFAIIGDPRNASDFGSFSTGTEDYPDRSTTIIFQIERFDGPVINLEGPGIEGSRSLAARPLPGNFPALLFANRELFPRGVDVILTAGEKLAALPRSVRLSKERG